MKSIRIPDEADDRLEALSNELPGDPAKSSLLGEAVKSYYDDLAAQALIEDKTGLADIDDASPARK